MRTLRLLAALAVFCLLEAIDPSVALGSSGARVFALIVTNNRSIQLGRPDLRYADDDGAKYYELFRMIAAEEDVFLFTEFDQDTERLFPTLGKVARQPTRQAITGVASRLAREVEKVRRSGQAAEFYFVFAGHGDVDQGRGFIELKDGPLFAEDLEALLGGISATRSHVILDSCNSFFVLNPRKPGGRRFATPEDAARNLSRRLPNVGVFLSTSAEAEVFEWSELQSGIFSHAVRSGIAGAADANGDGIVSYEELQAFVDTAAAGVRNPAYRPKVYARGPGGNGAEALFSPALTHTTELRIEAPKNVRFTVRDGDDLPWIDAFKEVGTPLTIRLPMPRLAHGSVEELAVTENGSHVLRRYSLDDATRHGVTALSALAMGDPPSESRGPSDLFKMLFTRPFGPRALARYQEAKASEPAPVFGISRDDTERMSLLLTHVGEMEHRNRMLDMSGLVGLGALTLSGGILLDRQQGLSKSDSPGLYLAAFGAGAMIVGGIGLFLPSRAEKLHDEFVRRIGKERDPAPIVASTEEELHRVAKTYRDRRTWARWSGFGLAAMAISLVAIGDLAGEGSAKTDSLGLYLSGFIGLSGALAAFSSYYEYPTEQMVRLWDADPGIRQLPRVSVAPRVGGATVGLGGAF